jgi:hypothetical protein
MLAIGYPLDFVAVGNETARDLRIFRGRSGFRGGGSSTSDRLVALSFGSEKVEEEIELGVSILERRDSERSTESVESRRKEGDDVTD